MNSHKKNIILSLAVAFFAMGSFHAFSQITTNYTALKRFAREKMKTEEFLKQQALKWAEQNGLITKKDSMGMFFELQFIDDHGFPQYYVTQNANSAKTISTNLVYSGGGAGLSLSGSGVVAREWDAGSVRATHQEFGGRVSNQNSASIHYHSTHVAGTIIASGVVSSAKGMAPTAELRSFDWNYDAAEMASEAALGMQISNHSYGFLRGWGGSTWYGDTSVSNDEDYKFGFYDETSQSWDHVAYNAPYYLIIKAAGNDRNDQGTGHPPDGPYDCIDQLGISKNILTVGAVYDITSGYSKPSDVVMTGFSSWGPADDGRIKPDIVANGTSLYSTYSNSDNGYTFLTGTSMAAPSVTGSVALLIEHYTNIFGNDAKMRASTIKALIINTADEAGDADGPDYQFGWGLMNTKKAAMKISEADTADVIYEGMLVDGDTFTRYLKTNDSASIRVTLVWTDPPGNIPDIAVDPPDTILVNDLNLLITDTITTTNYYPWKLDKDDPSVSAVKGENNVDNVEQVDIAQADSGHVYKITVTHNGNLLHGRQLFSLVVSASFDNKVAPQTDFYASELTPGIGQTVYLFDASTNLPDSWKWSISPSTVEYLNGTSDTVPNPQVRFTASGVYNLSLVAGNAYGSDTLVKTSYITVFDDPGGYCESYSHDGWGYIERVQFCEIDNSSTYTNVGDSHPNDKYYEDWTSQSTQVVRGQTRKIVITNNVTDPEYTAYLDLFIWIDWNRDGDFFDENELVVENYNDGGGGTFYINIPIDAQPGNTRMRVRTHYYDDYGTNPCGNTDYGEVEDYTLEVIDASPVVWTGTINSNWTDAGNWNIGSVPNYTNDVTIPASPTGGVFPEIAVSDSVETNDIQLETGAGLTVNGVLKIFGRDN